MRGIMLLFSFVAVSVFAEEADKQVAEEVIAITKAQWAAEADKDVATAMKNVADEYTEFNPETPLRLDGKAISVRIGEALATGSDTSISAEMVNPKVQVYGDVAILSYNYVGATKDKGGEIEQVRAKSTRVYVKKNGQWMLVHANFASMN
jgi:ketosteroid isomerase-like protein